MNMVYDGYLVESHRSSCGLRAWPPRGIGASEPGWGPLGPQVVWRMQKTLGGASEMHYIRGPPRPHKHRNLTLWFRGLI